MNRRSAGGQSNRERRRLRGRFEEHPAEVDTFLDRYVSWAWGMESGTSHRSDFDREGYDRVTALIDGETILQNLRARFGDGLYNPVYHHGDNVPFERRVAHQLAHIHRHVLNAYTWAGESYE